VSAAQHHRVAIVGAGLAGVSPASPSRTRASRTSSSRDRIDCGPGRDHVNADRNDKLTGCEVISRG
jgi:hypothetical protein